MVGGGWYLGLDDQHGVSAAHVVQEADEVREAVGVADEAASHVEAAGQAREHQPVGQQALALADDAVAQRRA